MPEDIDMLQYHGEIYQNCDIEVYQDFLQTISFNELRRLYRWNAYRQDNSENSFIAPFTCIKCTERMYNHSVYDHETETWEWVNTIRCKNCTDNQNKYRRFKDWFNQICSLAEELNQDIYFASITRSHNFVGDAHEIRNVAVDATIKICKDFKDMINKRKNNRWQYFNSGLLVGELKWRRPGEPVYATGREEFYPSEFMGITTWGRVPLRITEEYEAHPHCHFVGLTPKVKMPYNKLIEIANENDMHVYFERIPAWKAKRYLSRYLGKDQPSYTDGSRPRIRGKKGKLYGYKIPKERITS